VPEVDGEDSSRWTTRRYGVRSADAPADFCNTLDQSKQKKQDILRTFFDELKVE
jgi:hypothetical protein